MKNYQMSKEIEEMARVSGKCKFYKSCTDCINACKGVTLNDCELYSRAKTLYKAGYRKVYGTVEQFDDIVESQRKEIERLKKENKALMQGQIDCADEGQQAIKEFAEKIKELCNADYINGFINNHKGKLTEQNIDDLLKKYGIGEEK